MLRLQSGFELDYANIYNESCIQERDVNNFERDEQRTDYRLGIIQYSHRDIQARKDRLPGPYSTERSHGGTAAFPSL